MRTLLLASRAGDSASRGGDHRRRLYGRLLVAVSLTVWLGALVLLLIGRQTPTLLLDALLSSLPLAGPPLLGGLIVSRQPNNRYGWLWCAMGLSATVTALAANYATAANSTQQPLPGVASTGIVADLGWATTVYLLPLLLLLFPDGRLPSDRWRPLVWLATVAALLLVVLVPLRPGVGSIAPVANPLGIDGAAGRAITNATIVCGYVLLSFVVIATLAPFVRLRRTRQHRVGQSSIDNELERQQLKWFAFAAAVLLISVAFSGLLGRELDGIADELLEAAAFAGLYAAVGIAILRYRLYDIDLIINRALVYAALTASISIIYMLTVGYLATVFNARGSFAISLAATGVVAVLFQTLRERIQRWVNRLMYGERDEPYVVLTALSRRLKNTLDAEQMLPTVAETVAAALKLPYVAVSARQHDGEERLLASHGDFSGEPVYLPLVYDNRPVGRLHVGGHLNQADMQLLQTVADQLGVAVHAVQLGDALQRSREQLVAAREEERRRLRRDLHDGLGPTLAALALEAAAVGELIDADPQRAATLADDLYHQIRATVGDVRRIVYQLRPPRLDELGLIGAIEEQAARFGTGTAAGGPQTVERPQPIRITVDVAQPLPPLPAAVEVAAFFIVREGLTNVLHHATARSCLVRLWIENGLQIELLDDGVGIAPAKQSGVGLLSMRERAAELGGSCAIERGPSGGTRVRAALPLPAR